MNLSQIFLISLFYNVGLSIVKIGFSAETKVIQRLVYDIQHGFYVDVGAFDPIFYSQTAHLHSKGWEGVNIDASYQRLKRFFVQRPGNININQAVDKDRKYAQMIKLNKEFQQGINPNYTQYLLKTSPQNAPKATGVVDEISTISLEELCHRFYKRTPTFMNLDVRGNEGRALQSNDWNNTKCRPQILFIEVKEATAENKQLSNGQVAVETIMLKNNYKKLSYGGLDQIWIEKDKFQIYSRKYQQYIQAQDNHTYVSILALDRQLINKTVANYNPQTMNKIHFDPQTSQSYIYTAKKGRNIVLSDLNKLNRQFTQKTLFQKRPILVICFDTVTNHIIINDELQKRQDFYLDVTVQEGKKHKLHFWKFKLKGQENAYTVYILDHEQLPAGKEVKVLSVHVKSIQELQAESAKLIGNATNIGVSKNFEQRNNNIIRQIEHMLQAGKQQLSNANSKNIKIIVISYALVFSLLLILAAYFLIRTIKKIPQGNIQNGSKIIS